MPDGTRHQGASRHESARREVTDARSWPLVALGAVLAVFVAACMVVLALVIPPDGSPTPDELEEARSEVLGWTESQAVLEERRSLAERRLQRLEWIDQEGGVAAIPIEDAMRLVAVDDDALGPSMDEGDSP